MLSETDDLLLRKAAFEDWKSMYRNVWSRPETAKYMAWRVTTDEEDAKALTLSCGFTYQYVEKKTDLRNGELYELEVYHKVIT